MKRKSTTKRKSRKKSTTTPKYVVEATVKMKSKKLTAPQAEALRVRTKKQVKGAVVKVKKV